MNSRRGKMWRLIAHELHRVMVDQLDRNPCLDMEDYLADAAKIKFVKKERKRWGRLR